MGGGRRIEDNAIERRIEYRDRGLRMVIFYMEVEGGRMKEQNCSFYPTDLILVMRYFAPFGISF